MTQYKNYIFLGFLWLLFFVTPFFAFAQDASVWTDQESYFPNDTVRVNIALPEEWFTECKTSLIGPQGNEFSVGSGGCGAGLKPVFERSGIEWTQSGEIHEPSKEYKSFAAQPKLGSSFGEWTLKVIVEQEEGVWGTLTTQFTYQSPPSTTGSTCRLENETTKTCEFLWFPITVTKGAGCGPNPVDIEILYEGSVYDLSIKQGNKAYIPEHSLTVYNDGSPCAANVLNMRFRAPGDQKEIRWAATHPEEAAAIASKLDKETVLEALSEKKSVSNVVLGDESLGLETQDVLGDDNSSAETQYVVESLEEESQGLRKLVKEISSSKFIVRLRSIFGKK